MMSFWGGYWLHEDIRSVETWRVGFHHLAFLLLWLCLIKARMQFRLCQVNLARRSCWVVRILLPGKLGLASFLHTISLILPKSRIMMADLLNNLLRHFVVSLLNRASICCRKPRYHWSLVQRGKAMVRDAPPKVVLVSHSTKDVATWSIISIFAFVIVRARGRWTYFPLLRCGTNSHGSTRSCRHNTPPCHITAYLRLADRLLLFRCPDLSLLLWRQWKITALSN